MMLKPYTSLGYPPYTVIRSFPDKEKSVIITLKANALDSWRMASPLCSCISPDLAAPLPKATLKWISST